MNQEPEILNLYPEHPPVLTGQEARQGTLYVRTSGRRWMVLGLLIALVTVLAVVIYYVGGIDTSQG
jgi:hypothetical protein